MSRYWVGGGTGFVGRTLVAQLLNAGHEVVPVSASGGQVHGVTVMKVDATNVEAVAASAQHCDGAFYCIGKVSRSEDAQEELHRAHVVATQAALKGLKQAGIRRVVYLSTSGTIAVGRDPKAVYTEQHPTPHDLIGRWPYYRSKLYAEQSALKLNEPGQFEVVVLNPSLFLGPGDERGSSTLDVRRIIAGSVPAVPRGGISIVDVRDVASVMLSAISKGRAGERYLVSGGNLPLSVFAGRVARLAGTKPPLLQLPKNRRLARFSAWAFSSAVETLGGSVEVELSSVDMGCYFWYCDAAKAKNELGFTPRSVDETLRDTVHDILATH